jgi:SAM-dependent methyltransferase
MNSFLIREIKENIKGLVTSKYIIIFIIGILFFPFVFIYSIIVHVIDYIILKNYYLNKNKWDLNISCGNTDGGGLNADIVKRDVPNFVLIKNIYKLPFKDKQFKNVLCSHTIEHVKNPENFFKELRRISKNVVLIIPPLWDTTSLFFLGEHKWQFLTLKTKHNNSLPAMFRLPFW